MDPDGMKNACTTKVLTSSAMVSATTTRMGNSCQNGRFRRRARPVRRDFGAGPSAAGVVSPGTGPGGAAPAGAVPAGAGTAGTGSAETGAAWAGTTGAGMTGTGPA